jgi:hypothetical protein
MTTTRYDGFSCAGDPVRVRHGMPILVECGRIQVHNQLSDDTCPDEPALSPADYTYFFDGTFSANFNDFSTATFIANNRYPDELGDAMGTGGTATVTFNFLATA